MTRVKIYLRSINEDGKKRLALCDSNGNGGIDDLTTDVPRGSTIIWALDRRSGLKNVTKIYTKAKEVIIFRNAPKKRFLSKGIKLKLPKDVEGEEKYGIVYMLCDGTQMELDPKIRIRP